MRWFEPARPAQVLLTEQVKGLRGVESWVLSVRLDDGTETTFAYGDPALLTGLATFAQAKLKAVLQDGLDQSALN